MIANLMAAYREGIATLDWMGADTRREALAKLEAIAPQDRLSGEMARLRGLDIRSDDLAGNVMRARGYSTTSSGWPSSASKVDRAEWRTTPQTVNAFYSASRNEIVFPAGILQPPFFDAGADDAANYGGIGSVIGHEISHAFDDQGSRFDGEGNLRNWWTADDRARFEAQDAQPGRAIRRLQPDAGLSRQRRADARRERRPTMPGSPIAVRAYRLAREGKPGAVIDGYTGEQRLFISFAQIWHDKVREAARIERLKVDPHSPGQFRANGAARNQGAFADAFERQARRRDVSPPEDRISLW